MRNSSSRLLLIIIIMLPLFLSARHNARVKPYPERKIFSYEIQGDTHWLGMGKGIVKYYALTDSVEHITEAAGYELGIVKDIAVSDSSLVWFVVNDSLLLTYDGISWIDKSIEIDQMSSGEVGHLTLDEIGVLWLVKGQYLLKYYNKTWEVESDSFPLKGEVTDIINSDGDIWIRSKNEFAVFKEGIWVIKILDDYYVSEEESYKFVKDKDDNLFSLYNQEIYTFKLDDKVEMVEFGEKYVSSFTFSSSGELIISNSDYDVGSDILSVYKNKKYPVYITQFYLHTSSVAPVLYNEKDGFLWVAIQGEIHKYKNKKVVVIKLWRDILDKIMNDNGEYLDLLDPYYEGQIIKGNGTLINEQEEGFWQYFKLDYYYSNDPEPIPYKEGNFVNGLKEDIWRNYSDKGELINSETYKNGYREGETLIYNKNNVVITKGNYHKDLKQGRWEEYSYHGELIGYKHYDNDLMHGSYTKLVKNGCYKLAIYERGKLVRDWKSYNKNGIEIYTTINPNLIKPPVLKKGEKKNGIIMTMLDKDFQPTDLLTEARYYRSVRYENDKLVSKAREYLLDGTLCVEGEVLPEEPIRFNGKVTHFNSDGKIIGQSNYVNGKKEGKCFTLTTSYYQETRNYKDAGYYRIAKYRNGKPVGVVRDYFMDGTLQFEGKLLSEFPSIYDGTVKFYYSNGKLKEKAKYKDLKQISVKYYDNE